MLIGFEASALQGCKSGVGYYAENLLGGLMAVAPEHDYLLLSNRDLRSSYSPISTERLHLGDYFPVRMAWMQGVLPGALRRLRPDVCHFPNYLAPLLCPNPYIVTVHDMSLFLHPRLHRFKKLVLDRTLVPLVAKRSSAIVTVSKTARAEIVRHLRVPKQKVRVVMNAVSPAFHPATDSAHAASVAAKYGLQEPYILYVGTVEPRKNLVRLIQAFARLRKRGLPHRLVMVGQPGWHCAPIYAEVEKQGLGSEAVFLGYVPGDDLPYLYSGATVMAFPSLYEGFGLPVLEAMACGTPVVTSRASSMEEVAGESALLVDPLSVDSIEEMLLRVIRDTDLRDELSRRGRTRSTYFTWERAARATLSLYEQVARSPRYEVGSMRYEV